MTVIIDLDAALSAHGVSLADVAQRTALTEEQLVQLEHGVYKSLRISTIEALCGAIGCKPGDLFAESSNLA